MTKLEQVKLLLDFYFAPWGAAKGEVWEGISKDRPFDDSTMSLLIKDILAGDMIFSESDVMCMRIVTG